MPLQWLNQPVEVDVIDATGTTTWAFIEPNNNPLRVFMTDMARHAERMPVGYKVDLVAAESNFSPDNTTNCIGAYD